jgi:hypothetical protein
MAKGKARSAGKTRQGSTRSQAGRVARQPDAAEIDGVNGGMPGPGERHRLIAEAAYYRAQRRGFRGGDPVQDWLEAESEVVVRLGGS